VVVAGRYGARPNLQLRRRQHHPRTRHRASCAIQSLRKGQ
jgi:hypothetical protein